MNQQLNCLPLALDRKQVAEQFGISLSQLDRLDNQGRIPAAFTIGQARRWWSAELIEFFRDGYTSRRQFESRIRPGSGWAPHDQHPEVGTA